MTNREWLLKEMQNMNDEEMAHFISSTNSISVDWLKQEYKEKIKLSEAEKVILENLDKWYKWIARDEDDDVYIYTSEPHKTSRGNWDTNVQRAYESLAPFNHLFKFIKWEDEKSYNIAELLESSDC